MIDLLVDSAGALLRALPTARPAQDRTGLELLLLGDDVIKLSGRFTAEQGDLGDPFNGLPHHFGRFEDLWGGPLSWAHREAPSMANSRSSFMRAKTAATASCSS